MGGIGKRIERLRPTWETQVVPGQSGLHSKNLSQKKKQNKEGRKGGKEGRKRKEKRKLY
jgi:hypothetical protein